MNLRSKKVLLCLTFLNLLSCTKGPVSIPETEAPRICSSTALETQMNTTLSSAVTDTDFSLQVERADGRIYSFNRGSVTPQTVFESASTSKLVSAVIILRLVDHGYLSLTDKPQAYISGWPILSSDSLFSMNLANLLSFTSGLTSEPLCINAGAFNFENCAKNIATTNSGNGIVPGTEFYYSGTHLQVAGLMAIKARNVSTWQDVFNEFKLQTGLFPTSVFDLPSSTNPRLAGGMHWTGAEYLNFLRALKTGSLLSANLQAQLLTDQIANATIGNSPSVTALNEQWHYGFGLWHECQNATVYNCTPGTRVSSPGTYGAYPFWDKQKNYIGMLSRQGGATTFNKGAELERLIRTSLDDWATCSTN
jgi:CubicO group peptidase (beta-lactamase class C family)